MPTSPSREEAWQCLSETWDIVVIGGGITGAGILREATRSGLKAVLIEQRDFAWGTSSRSSKLVHGGLRYLSQGHIKLTWAAVRERERLIREGPGLIEPLSFLLASYRGDRPSAWTYSAGLALYDMLAGCWDHERYSLTGFRRIAPLLSLEGLQAGFRYHDAQTDDSRLVLRVLREAMLAGGTALNYATAEELLRDDQGHEVVGVRVRDALADRTVECRGKVVISATGAWSDRLRKQVAGPPRMRPLRGSHLVFPSTRFPATEAFAIQHPLDHRAIFVIPWEGVTVVGTTDLDHERPLDEEPAITPGEVAYLMAALEARFPTLGLTLEDIVSTYSGVRPVVNTGKAEPSKEARDHVIWNEQGLLTVTGGKLTTFRLIARDAMKAVRNRLPSFPLPNRRRPLLDRIPANEDSLSVLPAPERRRLLGKYAADAPALVQAAGPGELEPIPDTTMLWAELRWAARMEWVIHLDDLLLRRVRLGLVARDGGRAFLPRIRAICQPELGWDDARWEQEEAIYLQLWRKHYSLPDIATIPDWRVQLAEAGLLPAPPMLPASSGAERPQRRLDASS